MMDTQTRNRPALELRTDYVDELADGLPRTGFLNHRSPLSALSPLTAKPLPSPMQPSTPGYDAQVRNQERAMVESLHSDARRASLGGDKLERRSLSPIAEQAMAARVHHMSMDTPVYLKAPQLPITAPNTPYSPQQQQHAVHGTAGRSMAEETRSMLLSGMTASQANDMGAAANRRLSAPVDALQQTRRQSVALISPELLQAHGHVYLGDPTKADVFVAPCALRRASGLVGGQVDGAVGSHEVTIRARIRPKNKDRKPFLLARSFDLDQLRATIPSTPTTPSQSRRQSGGPPSPEDWSSGARTPTTPQTPLGPLSSARRRSSLAAPGTRVGGYHQLKSSSKEMPVRELHLPHALSFCPRSPLADDL